MSVDVLDWLIALTLVLCTKFIWRYRRIFSIFYHVSTARYMARWINARWLLRTVELMVLIWSGYIHPCEKVIGIFFQNQIWSRLLDINRLCLICIKRSIEEVKMCQIYKRDYQKGPSDETLKKARYQFCDVKFGHRITVAMGLFDYKMCNLPQFPLISQTGEARVLFHDLLVLFWINNIFVNYTQLK